jgi:hypothetical protein
VLPRLVINQTFAQLAIESRAAQLTPRQVRMQMSVDVQPASFQASVGLPKVQIDQTESFASAGNKTVLRMAGDFYRESLQKGIDTIARISSEGAAFLRIENRRNAAVDIAKQSMEVDIRLSVTSMPSVPPQINFTGSDFALEWTPATMDVQWESIEATQAEFIPGSIYISLAPPPHIEISLEPGIEISLPANTGVGALVDAST